MDIMPWVTGVTSVANMLKVMMDARKSGLDFEQAKTEALSAREKSHSSDNSTDVSQMIISESLLAAYIEDIEKTEERLVKTINDPRYTPAEREKEEAVAQKSICVHLGKIKQYNAGMMPIGNLERIWKSYDCENA